MKEQFQRRHAPLLQSAYSEMLSLTGEATAGTRENHDSGRAAPRGYTATSAMQ